MKRRICVRSMGLGAVLMLIGLAVGAIVSPLAVSQGQTFLGDFECRSLTVVNRHGKPAIELYADDHQGASVVRIYSHQTGSKTVEMMSTKEADAVTIWDRQEENTFAVTMLSTDEKNGVYVVNPQTGKTAASMASDGAANYLLVSDYKHAMDAFYFMSPSLEDAGNLSTFYDRQKDKLVFNFGD